MIPPSSQRFGFHLSQQLILPILISIFLSVAIFIMVAALLQRSLLGFFMVIIMVGIVTVVGYLQFFIWCTEPWTIRVMSHGIVGKPPFGSQTELAWSDIYEVVPLPIHLASNVGQTAVRARDGRELRINDMLPRKEELFALIRQHAPQCRFDVEKSYWERLEWKL